MKIQEKRKKLNIEQSQLAKQIGTNAPMLSNIENYKCLPIPSMLMELCKALNCEINEIYDYEELYIKPKEFDNMLTGRTKFEPSVYKLTVRLPNSTRKILTQSNLEKCGYHSLKDLVWHCFKRFEKQLEIINKKTTKQNKCSVVIG